MLNEAFLAEKHSSMTSRYKLIADDFNMGEFRSSGILVSTGTGSTGWLYGAKRLTANVIHDIFE